MGSGMAISMRTETNPGYSSRTRRLLGELGLRLVGLLAGDLWFPFALSFAFGLF
jgi:hypothetical protein